MMMSASSRRYWSSWRRLAAGVSRGSGAFGFVQGQHRSSLEQLVCCAAAPVNSAAQLSSGHGQLDGAPTGDD
jgi:hypothetical protein